MSAYETFLRSKMISAPERGLEIEPGDINPLLKQHQAAIVRWALRKGNAAIFAAFGLGKTFMQLEIARLICAHAGGKFLIIAPLGVRQEFRRDAEKLGIEIKFARRFEECRGDGIFLTNYETIRDSKMDPRKFTGCSLDEAAILRGFGPMQFDLADRAIAQFTMKGETVYDPFGGLGTVPLRAVKLGRKGVSCELSPAYWRDSIYYCESAERQMATPSLFDLTEPEMNLVGSASE